MAADTAVSVAAGTSTHPAGTGASLGVAPTTIIGRSLGGTRTARVAVAGLAPLVAVVTATTLWDRPDLALVLATVLACTTAAAVVDVAVGRLPDPVLGVAALPIVGLVGAALVAGALNGRPPGELLGSVIGGPLTGVLALSGPVLVVHVISPTWMGFGDVKAATVVGAALGLVNPIAAPLAGAVASATALVAAGALDRRSVPLGPSLVVGAVASIVALRALGELPA